ncbi:ABC transporter ATP-binding protein [Roseovarius sp. M141]|uniref:ABC transporter ATP-binding protein n=1 Tax=Roseovarius sp. M141 TaxID=2583806 RepID=UPI0020CEC3D1|nr:ABC transporter ATP-binding protein [Roseovarius sp. M141]MCQ0093427.1 ABC transporter ATP-binding protein [Roseovarius sp. M141]
MSDPAKPVLSVRDLSVAYEGADASHSIIESVSFDLRPGEILGIVGESGSGKSVTCRALIRLLPSSRLKVTGGSVQLSDGRDVLAMSAKDLPQVRGRRIGMIFQNPASHLDPVMTIGRQIAESIRHHQGVGRRDAWARMLEILRQVGIPDPEGRANAYAHEFSGGMRQRAMIAVALACDPEILIADEPTTALDVTVQAQILRLLQQLRDERGLSIIFITHDLGVVYQLCDTVAVMYAGRICEYGPKHQVIRKPRHHYTAGLVACQPSSDGGSGPVHTISGQPPTAGRMPSGCRFHPRCEAGDALCKAEQPALIEAEPGHARACHHPVVANAEAEA